MLSRRSKGRLRADGRTMNASGRERAHWRAVRKRAVSPMVAMILLVAITVVLAATLYMLATNLTHGSGAPPLGTAFSWGTPVNASGTKPTGCASATLYCYSIEIVGAGGGLRATSFLLYLSNIVGANIGWTTDTVSLVSPNPNVVVGTYNVTIAAWTFVGSFIGTIGPGYTIVIQPSATTHAAGLLGEELVAVGVNGYSGTVPSSAFS